MSCLDFRPFPLPIRLLGPEEEMIREKALKRKPQARLEDKRKASSSGVALRVRTSSKTASP